MEHWFFEPENMDVYLKLHQGINSAYLATLIQLVVSCISGTASRPIRAAIVGSRRSGAGSGRSRHP
jgi:hypothetical protein